MFILIKIFSLSSSPLNMPRYFTFTFVRIQLIRHNNAFQDHGAVHYVCPDWPRVSQITDSETKTFWFKTVKPGRKTKKINCVFHATFALIPFRPYLKFSEFENRTVSVFIILSATNVSRPSDSVLVQPLLLRFVMGLSPCSLAYGTDQ